MRITRTIPGALLVGAVLFACGQADDRPAASTSGGTGSVPAPSPGGTIGSPDAGRPSDAGGDPDACGVAAHASADEVPELAIASDPPPPLGGAFKPGTYALSEMNAYVGEETTPPAGPGPGLTGAVGRGTIVVSGTRMRVLRSRSGGDAGAQAEEGSYTFEVKGTTLHKTKTCSSAVDERPLPFSATSNGFALFVDARHRELYVKVD